MIPLKIDSVKNEYFLTQNPTRKYDSMPIKLKNWFIITLSVILFSLIGVSLAQAECLITVQYKDGCPRSNADVFVRVPAEYIGNTDENGQVQCNLDDGGYTIYAVYSGSQFGPDTFLGVPGSATITNTDNDYPNGTEGCGVGECDGKRICVGDPKHIECDSWNTEYVLKKCCQCNGGTQLNPTEKYDETQDSDCPATNCPDTCDKDSNLLTFDYANDEPNYCQDLGVCTSYSCNYNHACADVDDADGIFLWESVVRTCSAECDENSDYKLVDSVCNYNCDNVNTCLYQGFCSINPYCDSNIRYYDGSCSGTGCSFTTEDCDIKDCKTPSPLTCVDIGTNSIKETGDDYSCQPSLCSVSETKDCNGPWICDFSKECTSQSCGSSNRYCYYDVNYKWDNFYPSTETNCIDGHDNDCDNLIDSSDPDCVTINNPPYPPSQPLGPTSGDTGVRYTYSTSTIDPDEDKIKSYIWDWGDGKTSNSKIGTASHAWRKTGTYQVSVRAKDEHGAISKSSPSLEVTITKSTPIKINWNLVLTCFLNSRERWSRNCNPEGCDIDSECFELAFFR